MVYLILIRVFHKNYDNNLYFILFYRKIYFINDGKLNYVV